jgi:hypothetical protein
MLEKVLRLAPDIGSNKRYDIDRLSRSSSYRAVERGELPVVRLGGRLRVPVARLLNLMGSVDHAPAGALPWLTDLSTPRR